MDNEYYVGSQHYLEDINGRIWLATDDGLRVHFENQLYKKVWPIRGSPWSKELYKVNCVICDHTGTIWCGTENDGLIRIIDPLKDLIEKVSPGINEEALPGNCIKAMYADNSHNLWIFGKGAFIKYNTVTGNSTSYRIWTRSVKRFDLVKTEINDVFMDEGGNLWFICLGPGAVFRFNPLTEKLFLYLVPRYITFQYFREHTGALWFGCVADNLFRLIPDSVFYITAKVPNRAYPGLQHEMKILEDKNKTLWMSFNGNIYYLKNSGLYSSFSDIRKFEFPFGESMASCLFQDRMGNLWFGRNGEIFKYSSSDGIAQVMELPVSKDKISNVFISVILEDKSSDIWFATRQNGLFKLPAGSKKIEQFLDIEKLPVSPAERELMDFLPGNGDYLWLATLGGIIRVEKETGQINKIPDYMDYGKYYGNWPLRIHEYRNGNILILNCIAGVLCYNPYDQTFTNFIISENKRRAYYDLIIDRSGRFWIAHSEEGGVYRLRSLKKKALRRSMLKVYPTSAVISCHQEMSFILMVINSRFLMKLCIIILQFLRFI